ncbi:MAG: hflC [Gammaproteobacteria bacterium]|jgi:membrane protease subunit HflC|nr:hflC [Gammaproteobacteria bacterium]
MRLIKNLGVAIIGLLVVLFFSVFTVNEGESAFVLRLGRIVKDGKTEQPAMQEPGLHFKIPIIDHVRYFDMRMQELATPALRPLTVVTKEQTYLLIEYFAKWRINDLTKFYTSTGGSVHWAETLLEQRINDIVRAEYGRRTSIQAISTDRANMMATIKEQADHIGKDQGVSVVDVRIQQITLPKDVMDSVFKRMATERKQFAEAKRAGGMEKSEEIRALADQEVTVIKARALMQGAAIRAKGDEEAAGIYAKTYNSDPAFYAFYRSLEAYENSFRDKNDILVLKPEGRFFHYFQGEPTNKGKKITS